MQARPVSCLALLSTGACAGRDDVGASEPFVPDLPNGGCEAPAYDWLPTDQMGELVERQEMEELSLNADAIDLLLESQGYERFTPVPYDVVTWRVRYLTQDRGRLVEATGFAALPDAEGEFPTLLWLHPTMGFTDACAPTALGIEGAAFPILFASMGFAVAAPDYLGMNGWGEPAGFLHPYVVAEPTAVASLDAVRALLRLQQEEGLGAVPDSGRVVHWGASEGGFAALWTDRYLPGYAPELSSAAVVAAIPPTDLPALATRAVSTFGETTFGLAAVLAATNPWFGSQGDLADVLTDAEPTWLASTLPEQMAASCTDLPAAECIEEVGDVYAAAFIEAAAAGDWAAAEPWGCYLAHSTLRVSEVPYESQAPVLLVLAEDDDLAWAPPARADVEALCDQGYAIEHLECAGADHVDGAVQSLPYQLAWVQARLAGERLAGECTVNEPVECAELE